ncbi:MAG: rod shape-determining protein MreC [Proteobacteria bacterium]|nr:rod shape-determining protein MreC [Pseudomonadota bacterium]
MAFRDGPFENLKVPLGITAAFAVIAAGAVAILLLIGDKRDALKTEGYGAVRGAFAKAAAPTNGVFAAPVRWVGSASDWIGDYFNAVDENRRLKQKVAQLEAVRDNNIALNNINRRYEALLNLRVQPAVEMATARTVAESRGPFANARLIDAGTDKRIRVGNPVINEQGLVGRVVGVTNSASRVLLLSDVASRTPVLVDRSDARAILVGDGGANPRLEFLRGVDSVKEGDRILSSGDGGIFPRGLPVGEAAKALDGSWRVKLYAERGDLDYVRVLLFQDFSQLLKPDTLNAPPLASLQTAPQPSPELAAKIDALHPARTYPGAAAPKPAVAAPVAAQPTPAKTPAPAAKVAAPASDKAADKGKADKGKVAAKSDKKGATDKPASGKSTADKASAPKAGAKPAPAKTGTPKKPVPYNRLKNADAQGAGGRQ